MRAARLVAFENGDTRSLTFRDLAHLRLDNIAATGKHSKHAHLSHYDTALLYQVCQAKNVSSRQLSYTASVLKYMKQTAN